MTEQSRLLCAFPYTKSITTDAQRSGDGALDCERQNLSGWMKSRSKAPSPLRSAGALQKSLLRFSFRRRCRFWLRRQLEFQTVANQVPSRRRMGNLFFGTDNRHLHESGRDNSKVRIHSTWLSIHHTPHARAFGIGAGNL